MTVENITFEDETTGWVRYLVVDHQPGCQGGQGGALCYCPTTSRREKQHAWRYSALVDGKTAHCIVTADCDVAAADEELLDHGVLLAREAFEDLAAGKMIAYGPVVGDSEDFPDGPWADYLCREEPPPNPLQWPPKRRP